MLHTLRPGPDRPPTQISIPRVFGGVGVKVTKPLTSIRARRGRIDEHRYGTIVRGYQSLMLIRALQVACVEAFELKNFGFSLILIMIFCGKNYPSTSVD